MREPASVFVLKNRSIVVDIDFEAQFSDAVNIVKAMTSGALNYPHQERVHEKIFQEEFEELGLRRKKIEREYIDV